MKSHLKTGEISLNCDDFSPCKQFLIGCTTKTGLIFALASMCSCNYSMKKYKFIYKIKRCRCLWNTKYKKHLKLNKQWKIIYLHKNRDAGQLGWKLSHKRQGIPANICLFEVINRNTRKRCEICSKLTIKTPERTYFTPFSSVSIIDLEQVNVRWGILIRWDVPPRWDLSHHITAP